MVISNYAEVHERARLCALALRRLGVQQGDRVATVAWNTCRHLESWSLFFSPSFFSSSLCSQRSLSSPLGLLRARCHSVRLDNLSSGQDT